jgi:Rieske Fe-S protein
MTDVGMTDAGITRRHTLTGAAVVGVGLPMLAACGDDGGSTTDPATSPTSASPSASASETANPSDPATGKPAEPAADALTSTGDVPEGGGRIFAGEQVVVTQPTAGEFRCFTAVCTHRGCVVASVDGGSINCNCHGSRFSIADGSVETGPATSPLGEVPITVQGKSISLS